MQVTVIAFGQMTEVLGKRSLTLHNIPNTDQLKLQLQRLYPALNKINYFLAIDQEIISGNVVLRNNNLIALLPHYEST
jgi:hypothetical protein